MKRGQEYTDYINASFIDVCIKKFRCLNCKSHILLLLISLFKETQSAYEEHGLFCLGLAYESFHTFLIWCSHFQLKWLCNLDVLLIYIFLSLVDIVSAI